MNLKKIIFWNDSAIENKQNQTSIPSIENKQESNDIVHAIANKIIPMRHDMDKDPFPQADTVTTQSKGLFDAAEIKAFFNENHFGLGCHNGANYKSLEALELGRNGIIFKFQNILISLQERKRVKISKVQIELLA
jgi:hypothetical protein